MGNALVCLPYSYRVRKNRPACPNPIIGFISSLNKNKKKNKTPGFVLDEDSLVSEEALAAALLFHHHQRNGNSLPFRRSSSSIYPSPASTKKHGFTRSSTSRHPSLADSQDVNIGDLETDHFVLVHGGGFGAWCWYKTIAFLQEDGFKVDALNLTSSGVHFSDTNVITSLAEYAKPLTDFLDRLGKQDKVILVGHDLGGACISHVMEMFPTKIAKAVFVAATMLSSGQSALDLLSQQTGNNDLIQQAQIFLYANGKNKPPSAIDLDKALLRELLFNRSSAKDVALATVSMRPIPFAPVLEKLSLSDNNYSQIRRFYVTTQADCALPLALQQEMIRSNPPERVFQLKGADHAPFFSRPQALHRILVEISQLPPMHQA